MEIEREDRGERGERIFIPKTKGEAFVLWLFPFRIFIISRDYDRNLTEFQTFLGETVNDLKTRENAAAVPIVKDFCETVAKRILFVI